MRHPFATISLDVKALLLKIWTTGRENMKNKRPRRSEVSLAPSWFQRNKKLLALLTMVAPTAIWLLLR